MNSQSHRIMVTAALALALAGCGAVDPSGEPDIGYDGTVPDVTAGDAPRMAIVNYEPLDLSEPALRRQYARAEVIVTSAVGLWCDPANDGAVAALKALNPDVKVLGYFSAHATWLFWGEHSDRSATTNTLGWDWYQATKPYWSRTTTGDTMMSWPGKVLLNVLDPGCRRAMVGVIADHWQAHPNVIDGIFWDHFNMLLWVPGDLQGVEGEMDLDGDGVPHREDEDEKEAYRVASTSLVRELRSVLGDHVIQLVNGNRAALDSSFAAEVDGMMYENFPDVGFQGAGIESTLDLGRPNNLFAARRWPRRGNGGPWLILSNKHARYFVDEDGQGSYYRYAEFNRAVAALAGCLVSYHGKDREMTYGWPDVEITLGVPVSPAAHGDRTITREFERGRVALDFAAGAGAFPFGFEIVQDDTVAQSFTYPRVYP